MYCKFTSIPNFNDDNVSYLYPERTPAEQEEALRRMDAIFVYTTAILENQPVPAGIFDGLEIE